MTFFGIEFPFQPARSGTGGIAATLLADGEHELTNVPGIADVPTMCDLLGALGVQRVPVDQIAEPGVVRLRNGGDITPVAPSARLVGTRMDQGDVEGGADDLQVVGPEGGAIVAIQLARHAPPQEALLERVLEAGGVLRAVEGRERDHPRGIVEEGVEVGLGPLAAPRHEQPRPVHDVARPQVVGVGVGEGLGIGRGSWRGGRGHAVGGEQPIDRAAPQQEPGRQLPRQLGRANQAPHRGPRSLPPQGQEQLQYGFWDGPA